MQESTTGQFGLIKSLIDALPSAIFLVDDNFKIVDMNPSAREVFETPPDEIIQKLCGETLCCYHALTSEGGCGTTSACEHCVIRNSVTKSSRGESVNKSKYSLQVYKSGIRSEVQLLVTSFPFFCERKNVVVLVIDDITELVTLKKLLPICANCKSIRDDENYWQEISSYLSSNSSLEFTHSICPKCAKELYPDILT